MALSSVVPAGATAVAYNVTAVRPGGAGRLRVSPGDVDSSSASTLNWTRADDVVANGAVVRLDAARQIRVFNASRSQVELLVDVVGYYGAGGGDSMPPGRSGAGLRLARRAAAARTAANGAWAQAIRTVSTANGRRMAP